MAGRHRPQRRRRDWHQPREHRGCRGRSRHHRGGVPRDQRAASRGLTIPSAEKGTMPASTDPLKDLAFVGEWNVAGAMTLDEPMEISGWTGFEWLAGGGTVQRSTTEREGFPTPSPSSGPPTRGEGYVMHYFDSRGVSAHLQDEPGRPLVDAGPGAERASVGLAALDQRVQRGREHDPGPLGDVRRRLRLGARHHSPIRGSETRAERVSGSRPHR